MKTITKKRRAGIAGVSGVIIGIYMITILNNLIGGIVIISMASALLLWRFK